MEQVQSKGRQQLIVIQKIEALKVMKDVQVPQSKEGKKIQVTVDIKQKKHRRRRSQPSQMEQPDKFEKMYEQLLVKYTNILNDGKQKQQTKIQQKKIQVNLTEQIQQTVTNKAQTTSQKQNTINKRKQLQQQIFRNNNNNLNNINKQSDFEKQFINNMMMILQNDQESINQLLKQCKTMAKDC